MARTDSALQLAAIYTAADVFFNPTVEDNFPTVNLEAEACGTPVVTYDTGGCRETIGMHCSSCVADFNAALERIATLTEMRSEESTTEHEARHP